VIAGLALSPPVYRADQDHLIRRQLSCRNCADRAVDPAGFDPAETVFGGQGPDSLAALALRPPQRDLIESLRQAD